MPCGVSQGEIDWFEERFGTNDPDKLRDMLCRVLTEIEPISEKEQIIFLDQDIKDWFVKHKKWDEYRKGK